MSEQDELTEAVVDELKAVARRVQLRCETGDWDDRTYEDPNVIASRIIALVRADERKRIREALTQQEGISVVFEWINEEVDCSEAAHGWMEEAATVLVDNIANAIGLTDDAGPGPACRVCGCTHNQACEGGCWWVEPDLCSACADGGHDAN